MAKSIVFLCISLLALSAHPQTTAPTNPKASSGAPVDANGRNQVQTQVAKLSPALATLQDRVQQTLTRISLLNSSIAEARTLGATFADEVVNTNQPSAQDFSGSGENLGQNFSANYSGRAGVLAGQNFSVPSTPPQVGAVDGTSNAVTSRTVVLPITSQTARQMLLLQNDLERLIPVLLTLNAAPGATQNAPTHNQPASEVAPVYLPPTGR